jgi:hypothetical protein
MLGHEVLFMFDVNNAPRSNLKLKEYCNTGLIATDYWKKKK